MPILSDDNIETITFYDDHYELDQNLNNEYYEKNTYHRNHSNSDVFGSASAKRSGCV